MKKTTTKTAKRRKMPALDKYVIFSLACILVFTIAILIIFVVTGDEPAALVTCFFAAFAGELLSLAMIKRLKLRQEKRQEIDENNNNLDGFG